MHHLPQPLQAAVGAAILTTVLCAGACDRNAARRPPSASERDAVELRIAAYLRAVADLPDDVTVRLVALEPTEAHGLLQAEVDVGNAAHRQRVHFVISRDARYLVQGLLVDLSEDPFAPARRRLRTDGRPDLGSPEAPVRVVAYVDFQCPFSARAYATLLDGILPAHGDDVHLVLKHFPLEAVHPWAARASLGAACAHAQDEALFWSVADLLFRGQDAITEENLGERLRNHVAANGGDAARFARCFDDATAQGAVAEDEDEGRSLGVRSTPTFFINGRKLEGARPFEELTAAIEAARANPPNGDPEAIHGAAKQP